MSNIFGTGKPSFKGTGTPDSNDVILYHATIITSDFSEKVMKMFDSPVAGSGQRTWKHKGRHATFQVLVHLHKYDTEPPSTGIYATAKAFAQALLTYENQDVQFCPFYTSGGANIYLKNSFNTVISLHVVSIEFDFLKKISSQYDIATITFKTNEFYDLSKLVLT